MKEVSEKYLKEIYLNVLKAIIIVLYFFILTSAYENVRSEYLEIGIKVFTMIFLFISIYIFEKAYKKDDGNLAIQGIEILVLSAYTLTTEHITNKFNFDFKSYSLVASYIFAIYFVLKSIVIYTNGRREVAENLSDIREIVKKEEPVKKEAIKKSKEENTKTEKENTTNKKTKTTKKTTDNKKITTNKESKPKATSVKTTETKTKTTDKKTTSSKKENKKVKTEKLENKKVETQKTEKPKTKRVKKEVKEND